MKEFEVAGIKIGPAHPPVIIAEIGINHGGCLETAFAMVDAAAAAGVKLLKHQTHIVEDEMSSEARSIMPGNADMPIYEIMASCALDKADEIQLQQYVQSKGMIFLSTPFSRAAALRLEEMKVPAYKVGSGECNNYPLIELIASFGKPMIISTGMNTVERIQKTVDIIERHGVDYALLHTTNLYPTPNRLVRLGAMMEVADAFPGVVYGLSDHTVTNHACLGAVALGASILERHFTDRMDREGPDIVCSMDPVACRELIEGAQILWEQRGGKKGPAPEEQVTIDFAFASVCSLRDIKKGEVFNTDNIWVKRPGTGEIPAEGFDELMGKRSASDIAADVQLKRTDVEREA